MPTCSARCSAVGRVREFPAVAGRLNALMTLAIAGFTVIGGLMATVTPLSWPIAASGILSLAAASLAWRLDEPPREPGSAADSFFATGVSAARRVLRVPSLRWAATLGALPWVAGFATFTVWQPVLIGYEVPVAAFGWVAAGMMLVRGDRRVERGLVLAAARDERRAAAAARHRGDRAARR